MKIVKIETELLNIPLKKTFKTSLRQVSRSENIIVKLYTDDGEVGIGAAPPTTVITGETLESIKGALNNCIAPAIMGMDIEELEYIQEKIQNCMVKNTSAKAAADIAIYDLFGKRFKVPLYKLFGGSRKEIETDITISVNSPEEMSEDAFRYVNKGYTTLKTKVGADSKLDIERVKAIRDTVGSNIKIRLDANQGWTPKEAVRTIRRLEDMGLDIELVEQPVKAHDIEGLKFVTDNVSTPIMADEALFSPKDAFEILKLRAADILNIKLMKSGGLHNALKINAMAEVCGVQCMIGCMIESKIGITAATHLAVAKLNITSADLDASELLAEDPIDGGVEIKGSRLILGEGFGLGIKGLKNI